MSIVSKITNYFRSTSNPSPPATNQELTVNEGQDSQPNNESKWPHHPFYKRVFNHRYKLVLAPFLALFIPENNKPVEIPNTPIVKEKEKIKNSSLDKIEIATVSTIVALQIYLILMTLDTKLLNNSKSIAIHELGHFIAHQATQFKSKPEYIYAYANYDKGGLYKTSGGSEMKEEYTSLDEEMNDFIKTTCKYLICSRAGASIQNLAYGYNHFHGSLTDKADNIKEIKSALKTLWKYRPKQIGNFILFWLQLEKYTQQILKQADPEIVKTLADELSKAHYWNAYKIQKIIEKYELNKFPDFEDQIPLVKKMLKI